MPASVAAPARHSIAADLVSVIPHPRRTFPLLLEQHRPYLLMTFSAVSGVYVAYVTAERLHLADGVGLASTLVFVVLCGAGLGLLALAFTDVVLTATERAAGGTADGEMMAGVFGYATWPFLPLLCVVGTIEASVYGGALFSSGRPQAPAAVPIVVTILEVSTIALWLFLMLEGTATAASLSEGRAAKALGITLIRMVMILVLLAIVAVVSFML